MKENGIWAEVDQLDTTSLNKLISENKIDEKLVREIKKFITTEKSRRAYMSKI